MRLAFFIARRYLLLKRGAGFITLLSYLTILGLVVGVAALIITFAILDGFEETMREKITGFEGHVSIVAYHNEPIIDIDKVQEAVAALPNVTGQSPAIQKEALLNFGGIAEGVVVRGIRENEFGAVSNLPETLQSGAFSLSSAPAGAVIGSSLAARRGLTIGKKLFLIHPRQNAGILSQPVVREFIVTGIFDTGFFEFDDTVVFVALEEAQQLFLMTDFITAIDLRLANAADASIASKVLNDLLDYPYYARSWMSLRESLFAWLRTQRLPIVIIFGLIIVVGIFNLVSSHIMLVVEKKKDIGILRAMGATRSHILRIFMLEGLCIGLIGSGIGTGLAVGLQWLQNRYELITLSKDVYFIQSLPLSLNFTVVIGVILGVVVFSLLATLYPAVRASRLMPTEAIRHYT